MKTKLRHLIVALTLLSTIITQPSTASAQTTAFTYQGALNDGGSPANGSYDLRFALFDALAGGAQKGVTLTNTATAVSNGLFSVTLDFGNQFPGADRWLEMGVRTNGGGAFGVLTPRQPITPTPYSIYAGNAGSVPAASIGSGTANINISGNATTATSATTAGSATTATTANNFSGSLAGDVTGTQGATVASANLPRLNGTNVFTGTNTFNGVLLATNGNNQFTGNGGGLTNLTSTNLVGTIADARLSTNVALLNGTNVFTGTNRFAGVVVATNGNNQFTGTFTGNGAGVTNLNVNATNLNGVAKLTGGNTFSGAQIITNGNVGIGTTTPNAPLTVNAANSTHVEKMTLGSNVGVNFDVVDPAGYGLFAGVGGSGNAWLQAGRTDQAIAYNLILQASGGNVGIGTTNPGHKVDVNWGNTLNTAGFGDVEGSGPLLYLSTTPASGTVNIQSRNGHDIAFNTFPGGGGAQTELMRIKANGNVGIGTSQPFGPLEVSVAPTATDSLRLRMYAGGWPSGAAFDSFRFLTTAVGAPDGSPKQFSVGAGGVSIGYANVPTYGSSDALYVNGNVGIGTATPQQTLDVNGNINSRGHLIFNNPAGVDGVINVGPGGALWVRSDAVAGNITNFANLMILNAGNMQVYPEITCPAINLTSDRNAKEEFKPVNPREVLAKVARLPISEWQYKGRDQKPSDGTRHIGPMAQDFHEAFALGHDDKHITSVDADGVALAAIQGLNEKVDEKAARIQQLEQTVAELKELVTKLARQQNGGAK